MLIEWIIQFGPIVSFFVTFEGTRRNFFVATGVLMVMVVLATIASVVRDKRIPWFPVWSASFVVAFGGATLWFHDPGWLIVKDTLYDGLFGLGILVALAFKKNLLRKFFRPLFAISDAAWHILAVRWALFFLLSAALNEIVRHRFSSEFWVHYKIANTVVLILFGIWQFRLITKERLPELSNRFGMRRKF